MIKLSLPMARMLDDSGITPGRINQAIDVRLRRGPGAMVEGDHFPRLIRRATGLAVHNLSRRNRCILIQIGGPKIVYREYSRNRCEIILPGALPQTLRTGCNGLSVGQIFDLGRSAHLFHDAVIISFLPSWEGAVSIAIEPGWIGVRDQPTHHSHPNRTGAQARFDRA